MLSKLEFFEEMVEKNSLIRDAFSIISDILSFAHMEGFEDPQAFIVGGCVRDLILGEKINDVDIATNVPVDALEDIFKTHDIGRNKEFGLIVVERGGENFEVANFRTESNYSDGRHPDKVNFVSNFKEDAARRDFTINALALTCDGHIIDHFNGFTHLKFNSIQTVGIAEQRFAEDFLRMLRAIRFATRFDFEIEKETFEAIKANAHNITSVSAERITQELFKMASETGKKFANSLVLLKESGLLKEILPEIDVMDQHDHTPEHHPEGNVWEHVLSAIRQNNTSDRLINLSILFHDVGKPPCHFVDENGVNRFFKHERKGFHMMDKIAKRMKIDNDTKEAIKFATLNHMKFHLVNKMTTKKVVALMNDPNFDVLYKVSECDDKSRLHAFDPEKWNGKVEKIERIRENYFNSDGESKMDKLSLIKKTVNGKLVMELLGITTGPKIGKVIKKTIGWILDNEIDVNDIDKIKEFILSQK